MVTVGKVIEVMEQWADPRLKMNNDPIGLQIGSTEQAVTRVLVTLDVLETVVDEAIVNKVDLIIAHHPLLYMPLTAIDTNHSRGRMIAKLLKHNIAVYAAHTNLDIAHGGVNDMLSASLELSDVRLLEKTTTVADEVYGIGRIGRLKQPLTLEQLALTLKKVWQLDGVRFVGAPQKRIETVALLGGDGNRYIKKAAQSEADVLITGDIYYHQAHDAVELDFALLDAGHTIEKIMIPGVIAKLSGAPELASLVWIAATVSTNPFHYR